MPRSEQPSDSPQVPPVGDIPTSLSPIYCPATGTLGDEPLHCMWLGGNQSPSLSCVESKQREDRDGTGNERATDL